MTVEKPKPKQLVRPIIAEANSAMNQSQFLAITCNSLKARKKWRVHGAIGFGFASHWLKIWRESFKPITKRSDRNHAITFDSHLKTTLFYLLFVIFVIYFFAQVEVLWAFKLMWTCYTHPYIHKGQPQQQYSPKIISCSAFSLTVFLISFMVCVFDVKYILNWANSSLQELRVKNPRKWTFSTIFIMSILSCWVATKNCINFIYTAN